MVDLFAVAAWHAGTHWAFAPQPWLVGHVVTTFPWQSTTSCRSEEQLRAQPAPSPLASPMSDPLLLLAVASSPVLPSGLLVKPDGFSLPPHAAWKQAPARRAATRSVGREGMNGSVAVSARRRTSQTRVAGACGLVFTGSRCPGRTARTR